MATPQHAIAFCANAWAAEEFVTLPVRDGVTESYLRSTTNRQRRRSSW